MSEVVQDDETKGTAETTKQAWEVTEKQTEEDTNAKT